MDLKVGQKAPDINLPDQTGKLHRLSDYKGQWILIYFYPNDNTPGCTKEACGIRDNFPAFNKLKIKILGISKNSVKSHAKFAKKYNLPFTLLADEDKEVLKAYGSWGKKHILGKTYMGVKRISFLINPQGKIAKIYHTVKPLIHAEQVLADLSNLK